MVCVPASTVGNALGTSRPLKLSALPSSLFINTDRQAHSQRSAPLLLFASTDVGEPNVSESPRPAFAGTTCGGTSHASSNRAGDDRCAGPRGQRHCADHDG